MFGSGGEVHTVSPNDFGWLDFGHIAVSMALAYVFAFPLGWEEGLRQRNVGLRTFPLVAIGSCAYALVGQSIAAGNAEAEARVLQGLVAGIGFVGGGAILKDEDSVTGLATATGIWSTGAIGYATAQGLYLTAFVLSLANLLVIRTPKRRSKKKA